ncbi:MAG: UDP-N-acetylmuramoyl-L-alanine--D-glutamate ligase [Pseudomonadota bacterium]
MDDILKSKFLIYGMGKSGMASARAILSAGGQVICGDDRPLTEGDLPDGAQILDKSFPEDVRALILAPGVPLTHPKPHDIVQKAQEYNIPIWSDIELFYRKYRHNETVKFIAITGTNGKSTVTMLLAETLKYMGEHAIACGNIGTPIWDVPEKISGTGRTYLSIEISSYQADLCHDFAADIAIFLNLTPDHLERHGSMENYFMSKMRLVKGLKPNGHAIIPSEDIYGIRAKEMAPYSYDFTEDEHQKVAIAISDNVYLKGKHNLENARAVYGALRVLGFSEEHILSNIKKYTGLPHRLEYVTRKAHVTFINDSKATNAEATEKALKAYDNILWLVGGVAKSNGINALMSCLKGVNHVFIYGQDREIFATSFKNAGYVSYSSVKSLGEAVNAAWHYAHTLQHPCVILLSPAAASFDAFDNFEHRGTYFKQLVSAL